MKIFCGQSGVFYSSVVGRGDGVKGEVRSLVIRVWWDWLEFGFYGQGNGKLSESFKQGSDTI